MLSARSSLIRFALFSFMFIPLGAVTAAAAPLSPMPTTITTKTGQIIFDGVPQNPLAPADPVVISTGYRSASDVAKASLGVQVFDATGRGVYKSFKPVNLVAGQPVVLTYDVTLPKDAREGEYKVLTSVYISATWTQITSDQVASFVVEIPKVPPARLVWADEFDALDLMSAANPTGTWRPNSRWQNISSGGFKDFAGTNWNINPNHPEFAAYSPFSVKDGVLTIASFRTPTALQSAIKTQMVQQGIGGSVPAWSGGYLVQNPKVQTHKYGYFEYRVRWPNFGKGMFPALWLLGSEGGTDPQNKGAAEIDIMEMFGLPNQVKTTLHLKNNKQVGPSVAVGSYAIDTSQWHLYGLEWQPDRLRFFVDRNLAYEVVGPNAQFYTTTMSVRLNYAMDANWLPANARSDAATPERLFMNVDYVRVYDRLPF